MAEIRKTRPVSWIKAALNEFRGFPEGAQSICLAALTIAAEVARQISQSRFRAWAPAYLKSRWRSRAIRVVYAVQLADEVWVVHAFQKKSTKGIKTPKHEIGLIKKRLKTLKEMLR
jgi:phage-related protein